MKTVTTTGNNRREGAVEKLIGLAITPFIGAWVYVWENYVLIRYPISYWQLVALSVAFLLACKTFKPLSWAMGAIGAAAMVAQVASWVGLLTLPIIK